MPLARLRASLLLACAAARLGGAPSGAPLIARPGPARLLQTTPADPEEAAEPLCDAAALEAGCPAYCDDDEYDVSWRRKNQGTVLIWSAVAVGVIFLVILGLGSSQWFWNTYRTAQRLEEDVESMVLEQCDEAKKRIRDFAAPFVVCRASELLTLGRLEAHETLRDTRALTFVDTVRDPFFQRHMTVFVSHQWLGRDHPDPQNAHYRAICAALRSIAERAERALEDIYVWIDFSSIPQKAKSVQRLVVLSLPCIAATVDVFLVVAPAAKNDRGERCGVDTYHRRAWCRAEMFAHCSQRGVDVMFYATEAGLRPIFPERRAAAWEARRLDLERLAAEAKEEEDSPVSGPTSPFPLQPMPSDPTDPSPATITSLGPSTGPTPASSTRLATPSAGATPSSLELTPAPAPEIPVKTSPASPFVAEVDAFRGCLGIVHGDLTCCRLKHADGAPCDREELVLPIMGLFDKIYRERASDSLVASVYQMLLKGATRSTEDYFPKYFDYALPNGESIRKPLFGDLPRAIMDRIDEEYGVVRRKQAPYLTPGADTRRDASNAHHARSEHARRGRAHRAAGLAPRKTAATGRSLPEALGAELPELDTGNSVFRRDRQQRRDKTASVAALGASTDAGRESNVKSYRAMPSTGPAVGWHEGGGGSHGGSHGAASAPDAPEAGHKWRVMKKKKESIRKPLFGDLPRAIMDRIDEEVGAIRRKQAPYLTPGADTRRDASNIVHHAHSGHARRAYRRSQSHRTASAITQSTRKTASTRPTASTRQTASTAAVARSLSGLTPGSMFRSTTILDGNELPELDTHDTAGSVFRRKDAKMKRDKTASVEALGASTDKGVESNVKHYRAMPSMGPAPGWTETRGERSGSHARGAHFGCHGASSAPDAPDAGA
eukprot:CAMPEP_0119296062 /NCGR_PEP_ID=MMETSP1329-20130426/50379_1 /TAXON_ID=114041 /ORGANISM="Genus nov. species nov., Strain RCC1024" /LENGTH=890 /DNA_ID=CAMNT_0007296993 /DNA_START=122 /DNA_END=2795 /DNA_ORIENTATION=+